LILFVTANSYKNNQINLKKSESPNPYSISGKSVSKNFTPTHPIYLSFFSYCQSMFKRLKFKPKYA